MKKLFSYSIFYYKNKKGDILRSPSGGANVVFTDIETLQVKAQEVGKARKRPSEEFVLEEKMAVEDRVS